MACSLSKGCLYCGQVQISGQNLCSESSVYQKTHHCLSGRQTYQQKKCAHVSLSLIQSRIIRVSKEVQYIFI